MLKLLLKVVLAVGTLISSNAFAEIDCQTHKVYCAIVKLAPHLDKDFAMDLSNEIYKNSKVYKTDPMLSVAIGMQENNFMNRSVEIITIRRETVCSDEGCEVKEKTKEVHDVGLFQINISTAERHGFDIERLKTDWRYSVECHFKVLQSKLNMCDNLGDEAWSCYHSANDKYRVPYMQKINNFYRIISGSDL